MSTFLTSRIYKDTGRCCCCDGYAVVSIEFRTRPTTICGKKCVFPPSFGASECLGGLFHQLQTDITTPDSLRNGQVWHKSFRLTVRHRGHVVEFNGKSRLSCHPFQSAKGQPGGKNPIVKYTQEGPMSFSAKARPFLQHKSSKCIQMHFTLLLSTVDRTRAYNVQTRHLNRSPLLTRPFLLIRGYALH